MQQMRKHLLCSALLKVAAIGCVTAAAYLMPASAQQLIMASPGNAPLTFGMNADEASQALGVPLNYIRGRPGEEMYLALPNVKGSALSSRNDGLYLQFRRGRLEGWKGDWANNRPCCN